MKKTFAQLFSMLFLCATAFADVYIEPCTADFVDPLYCRGNDCNCGAWAKIKGLYLTEKAGKRSVLVSPR